MHDDTKAPHACRPHRRGARRPRHEDPRHGEERRRALVTLTHQDRGFLLSEVDVLTERLVDEVALRTRAERERDEIAQRLSSLRAAIVATAPDAKREAWIAEALKRAVSAAQARDAWGHNKIGNAHFGALDRHVEMGMLAGYIDDEGNLIAPCCGIIGGGDIVTNAITGEPIEVPPQPCVLEANHDGDHRSANGVKWTTTTKGGAS